MSKDFLMCWSKSDYDLIDDFMLDCKMIKKDDISSFSIKSINNTHVNVLCLTKKGEMFICKKCTSIFEAFNELEVISND